MSRALKSTTFHAPAQLLLHRPRSIGLTSVQAKGLTFPLKMYLKNNHAKLEIGLCTRQEALRQAPGHCQTRLRTRELARITKHRMRD